MYVSIYIKGNEGEPATMRLREARRDNMVFTARKLLWVASMLVLLLGIPSFSVEARKLATFGEEVVFSASSHYKNGESTVSEYDRSNPSGPSHSHPPWDPPPRPRSIERAIPTSGPSPIEPTPQ
jgi:hypothetical protein